MRCRWKLSCFKVTFNAKPTRAQRTFVAFGDTEELKCMHSIHDSCLFGSAYLCESPFSKNDLVNDAEPLLQRSLQTGQVFSFETSNQKFSNRLQTLKQQYGTFLP